MSKRHCIEIFTSREISEISDIDKLEYFDINGKKIKLLPQSKILIIAIEDLELTIEHVKNILTMNPPGVRRTHPGVRLFLDWIYSLERAIESVRDAINCNEKSVIYCNPDYKESECYDWLNNAINQKPEELTDDSCFEDEDTWDLIRYLLSDYEKAINRKANQLVCVMHGDFTTCNIK